MERFVKGVEKLLLPIATKVSSNSYLIAMRDAFSSLLALIVAGSFFGIFNWVILSPTGTVMGEAGLNLGKLFTGLTGDAYLASNFVATLRNIQGLCAMVVNVSFELFSLLLVLAFAYRLAEMWGYKDKFTAMIVAFAAYLIVTPQKIVTEAGDSFTGFALKYFGSNAVLTAIIVTTVVTYIFIKLSSTDKLIIKLPDSVPPAVANSFRVIIPVTLTLGLTALLASILTWIGQPAINDLLYAVLQAPLMGFSQGLGFGILYQLLVWGFWWFGIHGHNVTAVIQNMVYQTAQLSNQTGETSYILTNGFFNAGLCFVLGLVIAIFLVSRRDDYRGVAKVAAPAMLFNIQEPLVFGLPIVLNPLLLIPYVLTPIVNTIVGYLLTSIGLIPVFKYVVPWTMPPFFYGLIGTGSLMGGVLQLIYIAISTLIFIPFVIASNKTALVEEN